MNMARASLILSSSSCVGCAATYQPCSTGLHSSLVIQRILPIGSAVYEYRAPSIYRKHVQLYPSVPEPHDRN